FPEAIALQKKLEQLYNSGITDQNIIKASYLASEYNQKYGRTFTNDILRNYKIDEKVDRTYMIYSGFFINMGIQNAFCLDEERYYPYHAHEYIECIYVYRGSYAHYVNGCYQQVNEGEMCILNAKNMHRERLARQDDLVFFLCITPKLLLQSIRFDEMDKKFIDFFDSNSHKRMMQNEYIYFEKESKDCIKEIFETLVCESSNIQIGSKEIIFGEFKRLFYTLANQYTAHYVSNEKIVTENRIFKDMKKYIAQNLSTVKRTELAEEYFFSPSYINTLFKKYEHLTFSQYVIEQRLHAACTLLKSGNESVNHIIDALGYANKSYFYAIFQERFGMSPSVYREINRKR
ncbi:MAG: AraC family transcriptional regulator, partial [Oscillospiraceae bacterium]